MNHKTQGVSLIEILISLFLLSIMLFGLDALGLIALRETKTTYYLAVAEQQLSNIVELLNAAKDADFSAIVMQWNKQNTQVLPQGIGEVRGSYPNYYLNIYWGNFPDHPCHKNKIGESGCLQINIKL